MVGGRFRVLRNFGPAATSIALAEDLRGAQRVWLVQIDVSASEAQLGLTLELQGRFALGVPGLARPVASGVDAGAAFLAFAAPLSGSVADAHVGPWSGARVAALATRIATALAPLHDQGIAYGCLRPELVAEADAGEVLFGFGVAALGRGWALATVLAHANSIADRSRLRVFKSDSYSIFKRENSMYEVGLAPYDGAIAAGTTFAVPVAPSPSAR